VRQVITYSCGINRIEDLQNNIGIPLEELALDLPEGDFGGGGGHELVALVRVYHKVDYHFLEVLENYRFLVFPVLNLNYTKLLEC
jgi:hypothetical protein